MTEDFLEDFLSDLCKDLTYAVDVEDLARVTKLNPNTISCFGYRSKAQLPNSKQLFQILLEVFRQNPQAAHRAIRKICKLFNLAAVPVNADTHTAVLTLKALVSALERGE